MMLNVASVLTIGLIILQAALVKSTALDDYVWKADENYGWKDLDVTVTDKIVGRGYTGLNCYYICSLTFTNGMLMCKYLSLLKV